MAKKQSFSFGQVRQESQLRKVQEAEDQGLKTNFTAIDNELISIYDFKKNKVIPAFPHIPIQVKYLYIIINSYCINNPFCWPEKEMLSKLLGTSVRAVDSYIEKAEKFDLIQVLQFKHGSKIRNVYIPLIINKTKTLENILFYGEEQSPTFSPSTTLPEFTYAQIAEKLRGKTEENWVFSGERRHKKQKEQPRDERCKFSEKEQETLITEDHHGKICRGEEGENDPSDTGAHGKICRVIRLIIKLIIKRMVPPETPPGQAQFSLFNHLL